MLVEPAALAAQLGDALHAAGVPVTPQRTTSFARSLPLVAPCDRRRLYWTARVAFVSAHDQLDAFDRVFAAVFEQRSPPPVDPADRRGDPSAPPLAPATTPPPRPLPSGAPSTGSAGPIARPRNDPGDEAAPASDGETVLAAASPLERLRDTSFADLEPAELAALQHLVRRLALATPLRLTRRSRPHAAGGRLDLRRSLRRARRTAGDPVRLARRRRRRRPRRLVLLCDVSGSMQPYTRAFLTLLQGAVAGVHAEAFVFATRMTRLTRALADSDPDAALARAAVTAPDWAGGTRLGASLRTFLDTYGRRGVARGAVVVILSDGWERDDPDLVGEQMARLRRLAWRIVWVNPRQAAPSFAPLAGGMAAALPHVDAFVSGHSLAALDDVVTAVTNRQARR